jgi:hypothetical protein
MEKLNATIAPHVIATAITHFGGTAKSLTFRKSIAALLG